MLIFRPVFLLVVPSPTLRSSLSNWLNDVLPGYQVLAVSSGTEALHLICPEKVSEILIDMHLPDMTCAELIWQIRRIHSCATITVTGWQENAILLEKLLSIGADRLISKDKLESIGNKIGLQIIADSN